MVSYDAMEDEMRMMERERVLRLKEKNNPEKIRQMNNERAIKLIGERIKEALRSAEWEKTIEGFDPAIRSKVSFEMSKTFGYGVHAGMEIMSQLAADVQTEHKVTE